MENTKIRETLSAFKQERAGIAKELALLDECIKKLEEYLNQNRDTTSNMAEPRSQNNASQQKNTQKTVIHMIEEVLGQAGELDLDGIVEGVGKVRGAPVSRPTISAAISRHYKAVGDESKIVRLGDGRYRLRTIGETKEIRNLFSRG